jgi:hypothetical protein
MLDVGCWLLVVGCWLLVVGCWMFPNYFCGDCLTPSVFPKDSIPQAMRERTTIRSLTQSHRAKAKRPDRRNFIPQAGRLPFATHCSGRLPQLQSLVPNSPPSALNFSKPVPIFPASFPNAKAPVPILRMAVPNFPTAFPNFSATLPIFPMVSPNLPATSPNFSPANLIYNDLFPRNLCEFQQNMVGRVTPCAPFSRHSAPARSGLTRPTCGCFDSQPSTLTTHENHP